MSVRLFKGLLVAALAVSIGAHWFLLQSVAWVNMVISYSQVAPLSEAISMTFDGAHPCKMCVAVKKGQQEERKHAVQKVETKFDFLHLDQFTYIAPALPFTLTASGSDAAVPRPETPPTPPPRAA